MMKLIYILTGGRPMTKIKSLFYDPLGDDVVNLYEDKFGRRWMATSKWSIFRVEHSSNEVDYD